MTDIVLFIQSDDGETRAQRLRVDGPLSIGRHHENTVCLDSDLVSRRHARVELLDDGLRVEDASSNGTMAGEVLLRRELLDVPYGTPIKIGNYTLQIDPAPAPAPAPLPARPAAKPPRPPAPTMPPVGRLASPLPVVMPSRAPSHMPPALAERLPGPSLAALASSLAPTLTRLAVAARASDDAPDSADDLSLRRAAHLALRAELGPDAFDAPKCDMPSARPRALQALRRIVERLGAPASADALASDLADEAMGLGPLEALLADPTVRAIMVTSPRSIFVETDRGVVGTEARFTDDERVLQVTARLLAPIGARLDALSPMIDVRLADGSRLNAVLQPVSRLGVCLTLRKATPRLTLEQLVARGALTGEMARFLVDGVIARRNVLIAGGAGCGKTTMLNALCGAIPQAERIVTVERTAELELAQRHVVSLVSPPASSSGSSESRRADVESHALVENARRMRADRIVVGECEGAETLGLLDAIGSGHDGSLTTTRAHSPREALARIESLARSGDTPRGWSGHDEALRARIAASVHLIVQMTRFRDGSRRVTAVDEVDGLEGAGEIGLRPVFGFVRSGTDDGGEVKGEFRTSEVLAARLG